MKKLIRATTVPQSLEAFCKGLLRELSEKYEVIGLSSPGKDLDYVAEREGVRTIAVPMARRVSVWKDIKSLVQMVRVFKKEKPYCVHSMTPKAGLICMLAGWLTNVPVRIHTFTGLVWPTTRGPMRRILMLTDKLTCSCATHIIPEGEGVKNDLIAGGITTKPLRVLGYGNVKGIDLSYYDKTEEVIEESSKLRDYNKFTFLFVGRIVRDKGINELVQAFLKLYTTNALIRLVLVGELEQNLDPINDQTLQNIELYDDILAVGPTDDVRPWYAASDCFVMPSYREGFPNTVIEAGAMGLPSIVTDINGSREIIVDGENGVIVPPEDVDSLYEAMKTMIESNLLRKKMANKSREMIESRFEQSFVRKCLYDFYDEVL